MGSRGDEDRGLAITEGSSRRVGVGEPHLRIERHMQALRAGGTPRKQKQLGSEVPNALSGGYSPRGAARARALKSGRALRR